MLSYQHSYHAGCLADVHKHAILSVLLTSLVQKERPLSYMETHAGRGIYDLDSPDAKKTGEAEQGIQLIQQAGILPPDHPYREALLNVQKRYGTNIYAGSPGIARELLRPQDDLYLMELHPQEVRHLRRSFREKNIHIHFREGCEGALAISPPKARRGLLLIDPSYELKTDYQECVTFIQKIHQKWPQAVIALWYPMLASQAHLSMINGLEKQAFSHVSHRVFQYANPSETPGMFGSGMYLINTPWGLEEALNDIDEMLDKTLLRGVSVKRT